VFNGKMKAITFSYDDGVTQDKKLIDILNRYGLKATFNINSQLLGKENTLEIECQNINHTKIKRSEIKDVYEGHEVAVHTLTHPNLTKLDESEIIRQVEEDRKNIEALVGYNVVGMAYPCGGINNNDYVAKVIKDNTKIRYSRTITSTHRFDLQDNLLRFNPTVHHMKWDEMFILADRFINLNAITPQIFYIWGHSYEFDIHNTWSRFDEFCSLISNKEEIFYGTNREILL